MSTTPTPRRPTARQTLAREIAEAQHGCEVPRRHHHLEASSCGYCDIIGVVAAKKVLERPELVRQVLAEAAGVDLEAPPETWTLDDLIVQAGHRLTYRDPRPGDNDTRLISWLLGELCARLPSSVPVERLPEPGEPQVKGVDALEVLARANQENDR